MEDVKIRKPRTDALFRRTKITNLVSYLRLEFNIGLIHQGMSFCMHKHFFKCEFKQAHFFISKITTVIVGNFETILRVCVTKEKQF